MENQEHSAINPVNSVEKEGKSVPGWVEYFQDVGRKIGYALEGVVDIVISENGSREGRHMRLKKDILKSDQFGAWLRAENYTLLFENSRRQRVNNYNNKSTMARNNKSKLGEGQTSEGVGKHALILEEGANSTDTQPGLETNEPHVTEKNRSKGKTIMGLDGENDTVLPKDVESNNSVPMNATNYEIRHQHSSGGVHGIRYDHNMDTRCRIAATA
ncbi:hypothetical protein RND71_028360 [Anisodus tanguticus]|uniref:Uncharacterized protein n=1 Tax=Anisodus tanguticus TaxID=243964 RepID=A0AAE1RKX9_9SOLA|nr:hypothetical protein RND71_028360 [Anisodus tanguticus]